MSRARGSVDCGPSHSGPSTLCCGPPGGDRVPLVLSPKVSAQSQIYSFCWCRTAWRPWRLPSSFRHLRGGHCCDALWVIAQSTCSCCCWLRVTAPPPPHLTQVCGGVQANRPGKQSSQRSRNLGTAQTQKLGAKQGSVIHRTLRLVRRP